MVQAGVQVALAVHIGQVAYIELALEHIASQLNILEPELVIDNIVANLKPEPVSYKHLDVYKRQRFLGRVPYVGVLSTRVRF